MMRHIGKLVGFSGILMMFPLSGIIGPWITHTFIAHRMPDGERVILNVADGVRGVSICISIGLIILMTGIVIEMIQSFRKKNGNRTTT